MEMEIAAEKLNSNNSNSLIKNNIKYESYLNNSSNTITHSTIKAWLFWLAADVVSQWRSLPVEECNVSKIFEHLNPELYQGNSLLLNLLSSTSNNKSFLENLDVEFKKSYKQEFKYFSSSGIIRWLLLSIKDATIFLSKYTQSCSEQLNSNLDNLQPQLHQQQEKYFYSLIPGGTKTAEEYLNVLCEQLNLLIKEYELQYEESLYRSNGSRHSFEKLSTQISHWWNFDKQQKADSILNALVLIYKYQLSGQLYSAGCQILKSLDSQAQERRMMVGEVDRYLETLQDWYAQASSVLPLNVAFLKQYLSPRINAIQLLEDIEQWANSTRYEWASLDTVKISSLKQEILLRLQPICCEFYAECFQVKEKINSNVTDGI